MLFEYKELKIKHGTPSYEYKGSYCFNCYGAKIRAHKESEKNHVGQTV
jgi:hypothetical protein